jgi:hypothetical protein
MTILWPRLPATVAEREFESLPADGPRSGTVRHPAQTYTPVGGSRATDADVRALINGLVVLSEQHGFPERQPTRSRVAFDRGATGVLRSALDLSWSEAGHRGTWSFIAIVALPHLTYWRFGTDNPERWIATDLTRHTWARLWWQAVVFENDPQILVELTESDLNQLLERRTLGGDARVTCALARAVVERTPDGGTMRRVIIRDATARLRRRLEFIDTAAVDDPDLGALCRAEVFASQQRYLSGFGYRDVQTRRHSDERIEGAED